MGYQQNITMIIIVLLVGLALYFTLTAEVPEQQVNKTVDTSEAEALLMKGIAFGKGQNSYTYSFTRDANGYSTTYTLTKGVNESMVEIENPISKKQAYFYDNDTILCIEFGKKSKCSSVKGDARLSNYLASLQAEFFSDARIEKNINDMNYLLSNNYVILNKEIKTKAVGNDSCSEVAYTIDFTNISLGEAARFGIGSNAPKLFLRSMCTDNSTGYRHEETLNYTFDGIMHTQAISLVSFKPGQPDNLTRPENLSKGAVDILSEERGEAIKLAKCFTEKEGTERESCVAKIALQLRRKDLCDISGSRKDQCLIAIVPITKDVTICDDISSLSFKDDCYTELAGAYKNSTYCSSIQNASKVSFCMKVSQPPKPVGNQTNTTNSSNGGGVDILDFMKQLDNNTANKSQENGTNSTG
jgi:hypothetical protein